MPSAVYYKDSDGSVIGSTTSRRKVDIGKELPHWGRGISALEVSDSELDASNMIRTVVNGILVSVPDTAFLQRQAKLRTDRISGISRLKQLGLSDDQLTALFP